MRSTSAHNLAIRIVLTTTSWFLGIRPGAHAGGAGAGGGGRDVVLRRRRRAREGLGLASRHVRARPARAPGEYGDEPGVLATPPALMRHGRPRQGEMGCLASRTIAITCNLLRCVGRLEVWGLTATRHVRATDAVSSMYLELSCNSNSVACEPQIVLFRVFVYLGVVVRDFWSDFGTFWDNLFRLMYVTCRPVR